MCFTETAKGNFRLRPLYYVSDADKQWYKDYYGIRYSDAYEVYGLKRTGCCGCAISARAASDLELIRPYEPNVVTAAWNIFGDSYRYRAQYKALAAAQLETLNSEAFDIDAATMKAITGLEESAAEHLDQLQAAPVYTAPETKEQKQEDEQEEDFDETLSTEDSMIKDFSEMFDNEQDEQKQH